MVTQTVEKGYKQTEIGIIPDDWKTQNIMENSTLKARIGWQGLTTAEYRSTGSFYLVTGTDFINGKIDWDNCVFIDEKRYSQDKNIQLKTGDVLVTKDGTIGKIAYISALPLPATLNSGVFVIRPKVRAYYSLFLYYILSSPYFTKFLKKLQAGSTINHLYQKDFVSFIFIIPEHSEQKKIAKVLSVVDAIIESLDKLIEKKKDIRQGAMQELLTGKKRLIGFIDIQTKPKNKIYEFGNIPEDWNLKTLEQLCKKGDLVRGPFGGSLKKEFFVTKGIKVYEQKNAIYKDAELGSYFIDDRRFAELKRFEVLPGDFIISCSGTIGKIFQIPDNAPKGIINQALLKIRVDNSSVFDQYFFHYFNWDVFQARITDSTQGGAMKNLVGMDVFRNTLIPLPPTKEEQSAIAKVLSNMDAEIEALEQKRDKYKQLKVGLMQQLLTGRIRLKCKN